MQDFFVLEDLQGETHRFGEILIKLGLINQFEFFALVKLQRETGKKLASLAVETGLLPEKEAVRILSRVFSSHWIALSETEISLMALRCVPFHIADKYKILPFKRGKHALAIATAEPKDLKTIDDLKLILGRPITPYIGISSLINDALLKSYAFLNQNSGAEVYYYKAIENPSLKKKFGEIVASVAPQKNEAKKNTTVVTPFSPTSTGFSGETIAAGNSSTTGLTQSAQSLDLSETFPVVVEVKDHGDCKVLVVDNDNLVVQTIRNALKGDTFFVGVAQRGRDAVQKIKSESWDVIIMEGMLPDIPGFEICRQLKKNPKFRHIPVVMMSATYKGWRFKQDVIQSHGADDFIDKPFTPVAIKTLVQRLRVSEKTSVLEAPPEVQRVVAGSLAYVENSQFQKAIDLLKEQLKVHPESADLYYAAGVVFERMQNEFEAIWYFERTIEIAPEHFDATYRLAQIYQRKEFFNKAIEMLERALRLCEDEELKKQIKENLFNIL